MSDRFAEYLERIGDIERDLRRHDVPDNLVDDFLRVTIALVTPEKAELQIILDRLSKYFLTALANVISAEGRGLVRGANMLPKSTIARASLEILNTYTDYFSGQPSLLLLVAGLLDVKKRSARGARQANARYVATLAIIFEPSISNVQIAKISGVNTSTIGRWQKDEAFLADLAHHKALAEDKRWLDVLRKAYFFSLHERGIITDEQLAEMPTET